MDDLSVTRGGIMELSAAQIYDQRKHDAYSFLKGLEKTLNSTLPPPTELRTEIRKTVGDLEDAFLSRFVIPRLSELMTAYDDMDASKASQALLSEYRTLRPRYCSGTPARKQRHPFAKIMDTKPSAIMQQWMSGHGNALTQSCPDFATRDPFPFKIVFEGKYFDKGGPGRATTELVRSIYQAFFYRGLPYDSSRKKGPIWDYEFACMLAGDVSEEGSLQRAWEALPSEVKRGFWEGANIYVMIVPKRQ
jgi:hypothetical protein